MPHAHTYPRTHRLGGSRAFAAVFDERVRESSGPLTVYAKPNGLEHARLGLSVSRRVGIAARRNRIKRLLREAYRLERHDLSTGYDWVIVPRAHLPLRLEEYRRLLATLTRRLDEKWRRRARKPDSISAPAAASSERDAPKGVSRCDGC